MYLVDILLFQNTHNIRIHNNIFRACITTFSWNLCPNIEDRYLFKIIPS